MQEAFLQCLLCHILNANISPRSIDQLQNTTALVKEVTATALCYETFRDHLLTALSKFGVSENIQVFLAVCPGNLEGLQTTFCRSYETTLRQTCLSATISMLLSIILTGDWGGTLHVSSAIGVALINKQHLLSVPSTQCSHAVLRNRPRYAFVFHDRLIKSVRLLSKLPSDPISLFEQECTPLLNLPLQDWRGRLKAELDSHNSYQRDSMIQAVAQICRDLEVRCHTFEEPLRCERNRSSALEEELCQARASMESLEQKRIDDSLFLHTLEAEKSRLESSNDELFARIRKLQIASEQSNLQAETVLRQAEETYNHKEMQLKSTVLQLEKTVEAHQQDLKFMGERTVALGDELAKQESEKHDLSSEYSRLQVRLGEEQSSAEQHRRTVTRLNDLCNKLQGQLQETTRESDEARQSIVAKETEIVRLGNKTADLEGDLRQKKHELAGTTEKLEDLQARHYELAQSSTRALQEVEAQYESDLETVALKAAEQYHCIQVSGLNAFLFNYPNAINAWLFKSSSVFTSCAIYPR